MGSRLLMHPSSFQEGRHASARSHPARRREPTLHWTALAAARARAEGPQSDGASLGDGPAEQASDLRSPEPPGRFCSGSQRAPCAEPPSCPAQGVLGQAQGEDTSKNVLERSKNDLGRT
ncbi:unnamed protein product [Prorocentrum cordatum]|uniref:Uncharacterized protein n=1 Tax=Prorocentrum cordatum TaxID=2364126 RepID=A0ABN9U9A8_9DINO|nr:unnamed protein product [Polarella glacialis]